MMRHRWLAVVLISLLGLTVTAQSPVAEVDVVARDTQSAVHDVDVDARSAQYPFGDVDVDARNTALDRLTDLSDGMAGTVLGTFVDDSGDVHVRVVGGFRNSIEPAFSRLKKMPFRLSVKASRLNRRAIDEIRDSVTVLVAAARIPAVVYFDPAADIVRVQVPVDTPESLLNELRGVSDVLLVELTDAANVELTAGTKLSMTAPFNGGGAINGPGGVGCTSGFSVLRGGLDGMLTAGHCGYNSGPGTWYTGAKKSVGGQLVNAFAGSATASNDAMVLRASGATYSNTIFKGSSTTRRVTGASNPAVGTSLCVSGRNLATESCGVVDQVGVTLCSAGMCAKNLFKVTIKSGAAVWEGDSGAPVYSVNSSTGNATARGLQSAIPCKNCCSLVFYATQIAQALSATGSTIKQ